jgi:hypothetical protein
MSDNTALQVVVIPDLFTSFLTTPPLINPDYHLARKESEQWLASSWKCDLKARKRLHGIDASYFCAILAPKANHNRFRLICDWTNWVFPFDDLFDDGDLRDDPERATLVIGRLLNVMQDAKNEPMSLPIGAESEQRLIDCYTDFWERFKSGTEDLGVRERFVGALQDYCHGALQQVRDCSTSTSRDLEDLLAVRRSSISVLPLYALVEFGHQLDLPERLFEHASIQQIRALGLDIILIQNDILSYQKEEVSPQPQPPLVLSLDDLLTLLLGRGRETQPYHSLPQWGNERPRSVRPPRKAARGAFGTLRRTVRKSTALG